MSPSNKHMRRVYVLPNLFTTANLFLGMMAILKISQAAGNPDTPESMTHMATACWFILGAAIMDALDGKVARLMKAESEFGVQYDSLADLISFGAAPAFLIYTKFLADRPNQHLAATATVMFVVCGALRLARYNVQSADEEKKCFTGLPIPAAACMAITTFLLLNRIKLEWLIKGLPFMLMLLSLLMVSKIPYPSLKILKIERARSFQGLIATVLFILVILYGFKDYKEITVFGIFFLYLLFGIVVEIRQYFTGRKFSFDQVLEDNNVVSDVDEDLNSPEEVH